MESRQIISDEQTFQDFFQVMGERGATSEIFMEAGISANEAALRVDENDDYDYSYWNVAPLEVTKEAAAKIIESRGGIAAIKEFMAYNADWDQYREELEN